ncbi:MAG: helix-turn-helix transcriptional regulator [Rhodocyclaceae bacterium]|nr:helix-turn-helix transcriptional regulator [Rhodocyclaceae bacterium]
MGYSIYDNPQMDIKKAIAQNLGSWMQGPPELTIKQLAVKSGVGFGTIQRTKNGDGNITVQNLDALARAFGRRAVDLIAEPRLAGTPPSGVAEPSPPPYTQASNKSAAGSVTQLPKVDPQGTYMRELAKLAEAMSDEGRWQLMGQAKLLATTHPKAKANPAN